MSATAVRKFSVIYARVMAGYIVAYVACVFIMHPMDRALLFTAPKKLRVYRIAQNFREYGVNIFKAGALAALWPFITIGPKRLFVECGFFSMACFGVASSVSPRGVIQGASKLFWRKLAQEHRLRTPTLHAVSDKDGVCHIAHATAKPCVCKPVYGMYGRNVRRDTLENFARNCGPNEVLEGEILDAQGNRPLAFRVCTLNVHRRARVVTIFGMAFFGRRNHIDHSQWDRLRAHGRRLARVHQTRLPWAPLVGWDVVCDKRGRAVVLEGNLGGSLAFFGCLNAQLARRWVDDVRETWARGEYVNAYVNASEYD